MLIKTGFSISLANGDRQPTTCGIARVANSSIDARDGSSDGFQSLMYAHCMSWHVVPIVVEENVRHLNDVFDLERGSTFVHLSIQEVRHPDFEKFASPDPGG